MVFMFQVHAEPKRKISEQQGDGLYKVIAVGDIIKASNGFGINVKDIHGRFVEVVVLDRNGQAYGAVTSIEIGKGPIKITEATSGGPTIMTLNITDVIGEQRKRINLEIHSAKSR